MIGVGIIGAIVVGLVAGFLAEKIMGRDHGLVTNLIVGLVGALIGPFLLGIVGLMPAGEGIWVSIVVSTIGAVALLALLSLIKR